MIGGVTCGATCRVTGWMTSRTTSGMASGMASVATAGKGWPGSDQGRGVRTCAVEPLLIGFSRRLVMN